MSLFAQIDENNVVINVISAEPEYINSGSLGDPSRWLECSYEGTIRGRYPGVGYWYLPDRDEFIPPRPETNPSFIWNNQPGHLGRWVPRIPHPGNPDNGIEANWNEAAQRWDIIERPIPYPVNSEGRRYLWNDQAQNWIEIPVVY